MTSSLVSGRPRKLAPKAGAFMRTPTGSLRPEA
jgi:hypothetical protein